LTIAVSTCQDIRAAVSTWCEAGFANTLLAVSALKSKFIADFQLVDSQKVGREMKLRVRRVKPFARSDYGGMKYRRSTAPKIKASVVPIQSWIQSI
jgi:hypothetical protein